MRHVLVSLLLLTASCIGLTASAAEPLQKQVPERTVESTTKRTPQPLNKTQMPVQWQLDRLREAVMRLSSEVGDLKSRGTTDPNQVQQLSQRVAVLENALDVGNGSVTLRAAGNISIEAGGSLNLKAPQVNGRTPMLRADGMVRAETINTDQVIAESYTPGAGNIW